LGFDFRQKSSQEDNTPLSFYTENLIIPRQLQIRERRSLKDRNLGMGSDFKNGIASLFKCEGADGADPNTLSAFAAGCFANGFVLEGRDHSLKTASRKANGSDTELLLAYPHAFAAENTLVGIVSKERTAFIDGEVSFELSKSFCRQFYAEMFGNFLKFTGSVF